VPIAKLWVSLKGTGINTSIIKLTQKLQGSFTAEIKTGNKLSAVFLITKSYVKDFAYQLNYLKRFRNCTSLFGKCRVISKNKNSTGVGMCCLSLMSVLNNCEETGAPHSWPFLYIT
jgi:hypothetical protein